MSITIRYHSPLALLVCSVLSLHCGGGDRSAPGAGTNNGSGGSGAAGAGGLDSSSGGSCSASPCDTTKVPKCGNKVKEMGEQCDDGNTRSLDGCSSTCKEECLPGDACFHLPWVHAEDTFWKTESGERLSLRGTNLGNWLILEFWMMNQAMKLGAADINDQCTLENALTNRFGFAEKERLMGVYRDHWIESRDFDHLKELGYNVVRLPFLYSLVEDDQNPYTLRADAWKYLDWAIDEAEKRGIYVILDLHGAAGSQGWEHHSGCAGKNLLWGSTEYRNRTKWLWTELAKHYKTRSAVVGYGLLNEPWGTDAETLAAFSKELYDVIRPVDDQHIIILPGHNSGIDAYGIPGDQGMTNVALEMHFYPGFWGWRDAEDPAVVHSEWLHCSVTGTGETCAWNERVKNVKTPFLVGEFQPWTSLAEYGGQMTRKTHDIYNEYGWAGTSWAYKTVSFGGSDGNPANGWGWGVVTNSNAGGTFSSIDIESASKKNIEDYFTNFGTQSLLVHPGIQAWMNYEPTIGSRIEAENFTTHSGVRMEKTTDSGGGFNCSNINPGDSMTYALRNVVAGVYTISFRVAAQNAGSSLQLKTSQGTTDVAIPATGGWQDWQEVTGEVALGDGDEELAITSTGGEWNLNYFKLDPKP